MSFDAAAWAIKQDTKTPIEKLVLIVLADCANSENNLCYPSIPYISKHAMCSERAARYAIKSLQEQELITIYSAVGRSNHYQLHIKPLQTTTKPRQDVPQSEKVTPATGAQSTANDDTTTATGAPTPAPRAPKPVINQSITSKEPVIAKKQKPKTKLPDDFILTKGRANKAIEYWTRKNREDLKQQVRDIFDQFTNHHKQHGKTMACWESAWQTWYTNAIKFERKANEFTDYDQQKRDNRTEYIQRRFRPDADF